MSLRILRKFSQSLARFRNFAFLCTRFLFLILHFISLFIQGLSRGRTRIIFFKFKSTNTTNTPIKVNGDIFFHPVDKANSINNYFTSVSNIDSEPDLPDVPPLAPCYN
jgi:hypothetical protein